MKSLIFWIIAIVLAILTAQAVAMHEYLFAVITGFLAVASLAGTGSNDKDSKKGKGRPRAKADADW